MNLSKLVLVFVEIFALLLSGHSSAAQNLTAVVCDARLLSGRAYAATLYDGDDTIYVFGGAGGYSPFEIQTLKYSVSEDIIVATAGQPKFTSLGGGIVIDRKGNLYFLVGDVPTEINFEGDIIQYLPRTESFTNVSKLQQSSYHFGVIQPDEDTALIIGGWEDANMIQRLNLNNFKSEKLAEIPKNGKKYGFATSAIWVAEQNAAFIFDGREGFENVTKFDISANKFEILSNYFPRMWAGSQAVWDGKYGYIIGGFESSEEAPSDSIIQFDPNTGDIKFIRVHGYPALANEWFHGTSAVYVEKLNRIYMFGGHTYSSYGKYWDDIWYISLDPIVSPEPTTEESSSTTEEITSTTNTPVPTWGPVPINCVGLGDALYPFPGNCEKFVLCRDDHAYVFNCPEPLLFDATGLRCTWPDLASCE